MAEEDLTLRARIRDELSRPIERVRERIRGVGDETERTERRTRRGTAAFTRMGESLKRLSRAAGPALKKAMAAGAMAAGAAAGAALVKGFRGVMERSNLAAGFEASLGASEKRAAKLSKAAANVYAQNWGASLQEVAGAVEAVKSSVPGMRGASDKAVEKMTTDALALAQAFGLDVNEAVNGVRTLLSNGLAKDGGAAADMLTKGLQRAPSFMRGEMIEAIDEYGVHFAALGVDGPQALAMLADAGKSLGRIGLDKVGDSLKELTIRGTDMSEASVDAYKAAGVNADEMAKKMLKGGAEGQDALRQTAKGLLGIKDPAERANSAIALFGTPLEDLSVTEIPKFLRALETGAGGLGKFKGAADDAQDALGDTASAKFGKWRRGLENAVVNYTESTVIPQLEKLGAKAEEAAGKMQESGGASRALGGALAWVKNNAVYLGVAIGVLTAVVLVSKVAMFLWNAVLLILRGTLLLFRATVMLVRGAIIAWTVVQWALNAALMANPIGLAVVAIAALVGALVLAYHKSDTFRGIVDKLWGKIKEGLGHLGGLRDGFGWVIDKVESLIGWIGKIKFPKPPEWMSNAAGAVGDFFTGGDTATSRARGSGALGGTMAAHGAAIAATGARPTITNVGIGGGGHGSGSGDHQSGRALDLQGRGLSAYARHIRRAGGYASFHGSGSGRHLHAVPAASGDTATSRARRPGPRAGGGGGGVTIGKIHVDARGAASNVDVEMAVQQGIENWVRDREERG